MSRTGTVQVTLAIRDTFTPALQRATVAFHRVAYVVAQAFPQTMAAPILAKRKSQRPAYPATRHRR